MFSQATEARRLAEQIAAQAEASRKSVGFLFVILARAPPNSESEDSQENTRRWKNGLKPRRHLRSARLRWQRRSKPERFVVL